jgi:hypothetical protein
MNKGATKIDKKDENINKEKIKINKKDDSLAKKNQMIEHLHHQVYFLQIFNL